MTKETKRRIALMVAIVSPFALLLAGAHGGRVIIGGLICTIGACLILDIVWPDREDKR